MCMKREQGSKVNTRMKYKIHLLPSLIYSHFGTLFFFWKNYCIPCHFKSNRFKCLSWAVSQLLNHARADWHLEVVTVMLFCNWLIKSCSTVIHYHSHVKRPFCDTIADNMESQKPIVEAMRYWSIKDTNPTKGKFRYRDSNPGILRERQVC